MDEKKIFIKSLIKNLIPRRVLLYKGRSQKGSISLTFDDGPHPLYTQSILEILKINNIKATFFLTGTEAEKYPQLVKEIADNGHEIGNHNYSHRHIKRMGYKEIAGEIQQTNRIIQNITGSRPKFYRPPYGELNMSLLCSVFFKKMTLVLWSVDSNDSNDKSPTGIRERLKIVKPGDILLLHTDYPHTVAALPYLIEDIRESGFECVSISKIMLANKNGA